MKVAMITRSTLFSARGGDTVQVEQTALNLKRLGIEADIHLTHQQISYDQYDLLHFFNLTRPPDILYHTKRSSKPFALSPVYVDYREYDLIHRKGLPGIIFRSIPGINEYIKTIARWVKGTDRLMSYSYLLEGHRGSVNKILRKTSILLPNSVHEYERIIKDYDYKGEVATVTNGIDPQLFNITRNIEKDDHLVICAARIEGIKNQLNLIKALNDTKFRLMIIGASSPNQYSYYKQCKKIASGNITFTGPLPQEKLLDFYTKAKVHVLPSWFETTGLSSLEAAAMGCNIVITNKGDAKEYFKDSATYCDPSSPASIYQAVQTSASINPDTAFREKVINDFTWYKAARQTLDAYNKIICH